MLDCLEIKSYTSIRLGAICNIEIEHIDRDPETDIRIIYVPKDKTSAGTRVIPIRHKLEPTIDRLIEEAKRAGRKYLIDTWHDKYGNGGALVSRDFTALKTALGYSKEYSEHCIRKTIQAMWEAARIPLKTRR